MNVIVVIDDKGGMMFNKRRQCKDRELRKDMLLEVGNEKLWMNAYSYGQFEDEMGTNACVDEAFVDKAGIGEYCFVEDTLLAEYEDRIEKLIRYQWNRVYPSDMKLDINLHDGNWQLITTKEFVGSSHDKITKEVWKHV